MKIGVAQTRPHKGDIAHNIKEHIRLIDLAISESADTVIFPELSLTGYEPGLAKDLASRQDDERLDDLQTISDAAEITIGVGLPILSAYGVQIGMVVFQPGKPRVTYSKQYLHEDELPYFVPGREQVTLEQNGLKVALAICYELSVPEHSARAQNNHADIYIASVAKTAAGVLKANGSLSDIASKYSMIVLMSNCAGHCDDFLSAGNSAVWNTKGERVGELNETGEGILVYNTDTGDVSRLMV